MSHQPGVGLLGADTSALTMLGRPVERPEGERPRLECFRTTTPLTRETHRTSEWVSMPVGAHQRTAVAPDVYDVAIVYAPRDGQVLEAKSLREFGLSFKTTQASASTLAGQIAHDVLAATNAYWVEVSFRNPRGGGEGARSILRPSDALPEATTAADLALLERATAARSLLRCVTAENAMIGEHQRLHESSSWVSQCPVEPFLTDVYHVTVAYLPHNGRVLDPRSLWQDYAASFGNTRAFAEALAGQVAYDVLAVTGAPLVEVTFVQNIRGGWQIEAFQRLTAQAGLGREGGRG
jgi:NADPH-dependent 7-cyano-7-deazaguanine reductase QueF